MVNEGQIMPLDKQGAGDVKTCHCIHVTVTPTSLQIVYLQLDFSTKCFYGLFYLQIKRHYIRMNQSVVLKMQDIDAHFHKKFKSTVP